MSLVGSNIRGLLKSLVADPPVADTDRFQTFLQIWRGRPPNIHVDYMNRFALAGMKSLASASSHKEMPPVKQEGSHAQKATPVKMEMREGHEDVANEQSSASSQIQPLFNMQKLFADCVRSNSRKVSRRE